MAPMLDLVTATSPKTSKKSPALCACGRRRPKALPVCLECFDDLQRAAAGYEHAQGRVEELQKEVADLGKCLAEEQTEREEADRQVSELETLLEGQEGQAERLKELEADRDLLLSLTGISERRFEMERSQLECRALFTEVLS